MKIKADIQQAISKGMPVVALESTIISHGMPYPQNVECAIEIEQVVLDNGAIPATIGFIDGEAVIGMSKSEIEEFGKKGTEILKVSRRDIPLVLSQKLWGATTVASTMILAEKAGIKIFATGGIGGVHRGAELNWDVSADLTELSKTNVAVVCAGIKSILDLPMTLEFLETLGVPIVGYKTKSLPAFYCSESPYDIPQTLNSPEECSSFIKKKWEFGLDGGVIFANPIPKEFSQNYDEMEEVIVKALEKMKSLNIAGKETTPFLLKEISSMTKGESLASNIMLVKNNAKLASEIAKDFCGR